MAWESESLKKSGLLLDHHLQLRIITIGAPGGANKLKKRSKGRRECAGYNVDDDDAAQDDPHGGGELPRQELERKCQKVFMN